MSEFPRPVVDCHTTKHDTRADEPNTESPSGTKRCAIDTRYATDEYGADSFGKQEKHYRDAAVYGADDEPHCAVSTHAQLREILNEVRIGKEEVETNNGPRKVSRPAHLVEQEIEDQVLCHLKSRGEFFRAPTPFYLDRADNKLIQVGATSPELVKILDQLGLLPTQKHTRLVAAAIENGGDLSELRKRRHLAHMTQDAIYINAGDNRMIKVTHDSISEVPIGTDNIILISDDINLPPLATLQPYIDAVRPIVGIACTLLIPDLPFTQNMRARFATNATLTPDQALQTLITRILFMFATSDEYTLWPLLQHNGPTGSGKSTPFEILLSLLAGEFKEVSSFPSSLGDLVASITNSPLCVYDNIDGASLNDPSRAIYGDLICHMATGADVPLRELFKTNVLLKFKVHNHGFLTACTNAFDRVDIGRRCLVLEMEPPVDDQTRTKGNLIKETLARRAEILAEILVRVQNIVRAHRNFGSKEYRTQTRMAEYETFTLRCAEYEGSLECTEELWASHMESYRKGQLSDNSMVTAVQLWLGKSPANVGRQVSSATLFGELQNLYLELARHLPFKSPSAFGKNMWRNMAELRLLGLEVVKTRSGHDYCLNPGADHLTDCQKLYQDTAATVGRTLDYLVQAVERRNSIRASSIEFKDNTSDVDYPPSRPWSN